MSDNKQPAEGVALPVVIIGGCIIAFFVLWILYQIFTTAMTWVWSLVLWLFWYTFGLPFWWLSNYEPAHVLPVTPVGALTCFLLFCVLCFDDNLEEMFTKIGFGYGVVFVMGFLSSF